MILKKPWKIQRKNLSKEETQTGSTKGTWKARTIPVAIPALKPCAALQMGMDYL